MEVPVRLMEIVLFAYVNNFTRDSFVINVFNSSIQLKNNVFKNYFIFKFSVSTPCQPNQCLNGGTCIPQNGGLSYTCTCPSCYSGTNCQICNKKFNNNTNTKLKFIINIS